jgi:hypothetical protein
VKWDGYLMTSFQMMGSIHFSLELSGYPDVGETNEFFDRLKGKKIRMTVEEVLQ